MTFGAVGNGINQILPGGCVPPGSYGNSSDTSPELITITFPFHRYNLTTKVSDTEYIIHIIPTASLEGAHTLIGSSGEDYLDGGDGDDRLEGGAGNDHYSWGVWFPDDRGNDIIHDMSGADDHLDIGGSAAAAQLSRTGEHDSDLVISMGGDTLKIERYFVTAPGQESGYIETITFSDGTVWHMADVLIALGHTSSTNPDPSADPSAPVVAPAPQENGQDDSLPDATADTSILAGTAGRDVLTGSVDADIFFFSSRADVGLGKKRDVIMNFDHGVDRIDLSGIDANTKAAGNNAFTSLLTGKKPFTKAGQLHYDKKTGILSGNMDKDAAAEFQIQLKNKPALLKLSDFIL